MFLRTEGHLEQEVLISQGTRGEFSFKQSGAPCHHANSYSTRDTSIDWKLSAGKVQPGESTEPNEETVCRNLEIYRVLDTDASINSNKAARTGERADSFQRSWQFNLLESLK